MAAITTRIRLRHCDVPGEVPPNWLLNDGNLAINYADGNLFCSNSEGHITMIGTRDPITDENLINVLEDLEIPFAELLDTLGVDRT